MLAWTDPANLCKKCMSLKFLFHASLFGTVFCQVTHIPLAVAPQTTLLAVPAAQEEQRTQKKASPSHAPGICSLPLSSTSIVFRRHHSMSRNFQRCRTRLRHRWLRCLHFRLQVDRHMGVCSRQHELELQGVVLCSFAQARLLTVPVETQTWARRSSSCMRRQMRCQSQLADFLELLKGLGWDLGHLHMVARVPALLRPCKTPGRERWRPIQFT